MPDFSSGTLVEPKSAMNKQVNKNYKQKIYEDTASKTANFTCLLTLKT
jgi:hypothetical protein